MSENGKEPIILPHHEQQALCATRLPYRQGRKLTAVKVYSVNDESRHLLVFGVPSLNLRQETKALFAKFGKLQFNITKYPSEQFTETYHAVYENIQSARVAKKMLDTKNFYGGSLHVCYAPELEHVDDTREKLHQRQKSVVARLKNLQKSMVNVNSVNNLDINLEERIVLKDSEDKKLYMGNENNIGLGKRNATDFKSVKHCKLKKSRNFDRKTCVAITITENESANKSETLETADSETLSNSVCEVIDCTSADTETVTNINETLNYDNFGKELIRQIPYKAVNKIKFNLNKNN